jgi:hypothetical protein
MSRHLSEAGSRAGLWRSLAVLLTVVGVTCLVLWSLRSTPADPGAAGPAATGPAASRVPGPGHRATSGAATAPVTVRPLSLSIPALGLTTAVTRLGLMSDGTVQVPTNPMLAGWFRLGPPPGSMGSSVILGHVDSVDGPAVFAGLRYLSPGDRVAVRLSDGETADFRVSSVNTYANDVFPARSVYGPHGFRELDRVTGGGAYDAANGGYQANRVVRTRWVGSYPT